VTVRATARGDQRPSLAGARADVLVCGASFAGLAVARELAGAGADVLMVDRYEIGERQTSACAAPTPWLEAMGVSDAIRQEIPFMRFGTPHGAFRYRLPWSWSSFDYRSLCLELWEQCGDARFECAKVSARTAGGVATDRGELLAPLVVDALGWRRVLADAGYQPPSAPLSRGLEVHPHSHDGEDLDVWIDRSVVRHGYAWQVPAAGEQRVGVGSYEPRDHVKEPTRDLAGRLGMEAERWQGNWFPHRLREAADARTFFVGDSAGHCLPLSGEGIRPAFYFGTACGRELRDVLGGRRDARAALARYGDFSARHAGAYRLLLRGQRVLPRVPPRVLTAALRVLSRPAAVRRAFTWYLDQAPPSFASDPAPARRPAALAA
jgi:digeranylgeranylglycerophospholipid reductase